jgi:hypothetical protein
MSKNEIDRFWEWFRRVEWELYDEFSAELPLYQDLIRRLHQLDRGLVVDVGPIEKRGRDLIVSADGKEALFPTVMRLVDAVPEMERWRVQAFRPRRTGHMNVIYEGRLYETPNMFFDVTEKKGKLDIEVWFIEPEGLNRHHETVAKVVVGNYLGEYDYVKRVRSVKAYLVDQTADQATVYPTLKPMVMLPKWMEEWRGRD